MAPITDLPTADVWWVRERMDDSITLVFEPHVHPFLRCNVWHVKGRDADMVVDTGMGIRPLRPFVERELDGPLLAVATHYHLDHVGGLHEFEHRVIHEVEAEKVAEPQLGVLETAAFGLDTAGVYQEAGYEFPPLMVDAIPAGEPIEPYYEIAAAPATRAVQEGDVVDLGDRAFEVLHLPGHSPGSLGLWEEATGTLFSGDALYDGPLLDELDGSDIDVYLETIRRLREMPVTVVHGGHEGSFGRERLVELCDDYLDLRG